MPCIEDHLSAADLVDADVRDGLALYRAACLACLCRLGESCHDDCNGCLLLDCRCLCSMPF